MDIYKHLKSHAEQVEIVNLSNVATTVEFEANKLKTSKVQETKGTAVRVVRKGRLGFAASSDERAVEKLAANALESAAYGDQVPLFFPIPQTAPRVATFDRQISELPIPRLVDIGREIVELVLTIEPEARVNISLQRGVQQVSIRNHTGTEAMFSRSPFSISLEIDRIEGDDILILYDSFGVTTWEGDYLAFARRLGEKLKMARTVTAFHPGKMPVLFSPFGGLVWVLPLLEGLNGKNVYTGISPMKGKVSEHLFDRKISLVDDPTLDGRFGSAPYDDEGVPHRRNVLVEKGVLTSFFFDLRTAAQMGIASTGNGGRSLFSPPAPSPTNLVVAAGQTPLAKMLDGIEHGLLVDNVLGLGQGNIISGAFSNPLSLAFRIEQGEIVGRVKNASIAGNIYDLMKNVTAVSQEQEWVFTNLLIPYVLLPEMNVVTKQ